MSYWSRLDAIFFKEANEIKNKQYDYIVVGGGAYGTSFVHRILQLSPKSKILVLEKGDMLLPEHYQNLPPAYQSVFAETTAQPWVMSDSKYNVHGQVPFLGGRALYWNAWVPQPTPAQMVDWPQDVIDELKLEWHDVDTFIGRSTTIQVNGYTGEFHDVMRERLFTNLSKIPTSDYYDRASALDGAMATLNNNSNKAWQRFAPVNVLVNNITKYTQQIDVVLNCEAIGLDRSKLGISHIKTTKGKIEVGKAKVILALGVIEAITLTQPAFKENKLLGRNFIGHFRSQVLVRVPKEAAGVNNDLLQVAALYLSGMTLGREFHTHISCIYNPREEAQKDDLYRVIPDPTNLELYMDSDYIYLLLQSMAEIKGERTAQSANYIKATNDKTEIHFSLDKPELAVWDEIDKVLIQIAHVLANGNKVEYLQSNNTWSTKVPAISFMRDYNLIHEAGVMWMGNSAKDSVTDSWGKMHETNNMYVLGGALFPTCGSWNPTYTGMAMAYRLARKFSKK
ncbi:MAG: GMC oxidoreductase [Bacteroidota bacterium]